MKYNILVGGAAGQGINKVSQILSEVLNNYGYYTFNYRDYQSMVRGGHNFNVLSFSNEEIMSTDKMVDVLVALDSNTVYIHKKDLKKGGVIIQNDSSSVDKNLNLKLSGCLSKYFGISKDCLIKVVKKYFDNKEALDSVIFGYDSYENKIHLKKMNRKIQILSGSKAVAISAKDSGLNYYVTYPMTPATGVANEIAKLEDNRMSVFQGENEIGVASIGLGMSFTGKIVMVGTSGGGFDLMTESFSMQGISEIPLTVYLASRPGPATGVPTYTAQSDLNLALYSGHGEFVRVVCAPGDVFEAVEKTNELIYLAEKYGILSILLSDKHLAECEYSTNKIIGKKSQIKITRNIPGCKVVKASSYETNVSGNSTEDSSIVKQNMDNRLKKRKDIEFELLKMKTYKIYGRKKTKNLVVGWGSTKGAIVDAIKNLNVNFLQILYLEPFSKQIGRELAKYSNIILIENNATGQLGDLIRQKTGIEIQNKILKYDGRPFFADELNKQIKKFIK